MTSPSVPVESREQRRGASWRAREARLIRYFEAIPGEVFKSNGYLINSAIVDAFTALADEEDATLLAERDRARDLAAHLEEDSARLREQLEAVRRECYEAEVHQHVPPDLPLGPWISTYWLRTVLDTPGRS